MRATATNWFLSFADTSILCDPPVLTNKIETPQGRGKQCFRQQALRYNLHAGS
jgi:hypothetical protein